MILMPSSVLPVIPTARGAAKMDRMRGPLSTTWGQYIISWASYATSVSDVLQWHQTLSADMDATLALIKALSPGVCLESKGNVFTRPPSLGRLESSMKKALTAIPSNQPCQQTNTFHFRCDQNYLTTEMVFLKKQTKQTKQIPYLTFNYQG